MKVQNHPPHRHPSPSRPPSAPEKSPEPQEPQDSPPSGNVQGVLSRATYGAALYGLPALAGAAMGTSGVLPAVALGAGIAAITHPRSLKDAAIFGLTGACVGASLGYVSSLLSATPYAWVPVVASTAVGAGTQALFAHLQDS